MRSKSFGTPRTRAVGFTLIELLVVLAIVTILASLLLASVVQTREGARRSLCKSNLKQIGLALYNYEASYTQLPPAAVFVIDPVNSRVANSMVWGMSLLPFLDQSALTNAFDPGQAPWSTTGANASSGGNAALIAVNLPIFRCPSTAATMDQNITVWDSTTLGPACGSSKALGGLATLSNSITATWGLSDYFVVSDVRSPLYSSDLVAGIPGESVDRRHGMFYCGDSQADNVPVGINAAADMAINVGGLSRDASPKFANVTDGLSNTIMVAECAGRNQLWELNRNVTPAQDPSAVFYQHYCTQQNFGGGGWADPTNVSWIDGGQPSGNNDVSYSGTGSCVINCSNQFAKGFYSWHPGGSQFLMGDGSVRFFSRSMDNLTLAELVTRAGNEVSYGGF